MYTFTQYVYAYGSPPHTHITNTHKIHRLYTGARTALRTQDVHLTKYIHIYTYIHINIDIYMYIHMHAHTHIGTCIHMCVYIYICMCIRKQVVHMREDDPADAGNTFNDTRTYIYIYVYIDQ